MKTTKLYLETIDRTINSEREDKPYGDWSEEHEFLPVAIYSNAMGHWDSEEREVLGDIKSGDTVYILWINYSTGDSFGHGSGYGEVIWIFTDRILAYKAKNAWEKAGNKGSQVTFEVENGEKLTQYNPGAGYFENLDMVEISEFIVDEEND